MSRPNISPRGNQEKRSGRGFSIIELLVTITIIGALAAIAIQAYGTYITRAEISHTVNDMRGLDTFILLYKQVNNTYPSSLSDLPQGNTVDEWGNPYQYLLIEGNAKAKGHERKDKSLVPINSDYDLYSMGPDGKSVAPITAKASQDDIIRANNGAYFGPASDY
jgi:general secretion pathway protein G